MITFFNPFEAGTRLPAGLELTPLLVGSRLKSVGLTPPADCWICDRPEPQGGCGKGVSAPGTFGGKHSPLLELLPSLQQAVHAVSPS